MSSVDELRQYLMDKNLRLNGVTLGPHATKEGVADAILKSLKGLEARAAKGRPHECPEWDGLCIYPGDPEMDACSCEGVDR